MTGVIQKIPPAVLVLAVMAAMAAVVAIALTTGAHTVGTGAMYYNG